MELSEVDIFRPDKCELCNSIRLPKTAMSLRDLARCAAKTPRKVKVRQSIPEVDD